MERDTKKQIHVSEEEIVKQYKFMDLIKEINAEYEIQSGRKRLVFLQSFGCQMNENDSERLWGMLSEMGYCEGKNSEESDIIIFNTCCVRENAEEKVYGHLGALKKQKADNQEKIVAVCGCMMQQGHVVETIKKKYKHVDLVFGTHNLYRFPELLYNAMNENSPVIDVDESPGSITEGLPIERKDSIKAWVTVMYGCNNFCSYCIVPYVRGRERSRSIEDIVKEVKELGDKNYTEITLLGQNVNSYGKDFGDNTSFAGLLRELDKIEGIERIRFLTSHPKDLTEDIILAMRDLDKICEHLHLPIQAGSTRILQSMNRKYTKEDYLKLIGMLREKVPNIALTTDIIVGYPGETEEDFEETLDVLRKVRYDFAYTFLYSRRTGTPAAKNENQVSEEIKKSRFERLLEVQNKISKEINDKLLGTTEEILVEGLSKSSVWNYTGRTRTNKIVNFKGSKELVGKLVKVKITGTQTWSLEGEVISWR